MKLQAQLAYNALALQAGGDYKRLDALIQKYGSWSSAYEAESKHASDLERASKQLAKHDIRIIFPTDAEFPPLLAEIPWRPHALYVRGAPMEYKTALAIVGTRKATAVGLETAKRFSKELAQASVTIVSGLALGVDAASHEGALAGNGKTIAVLACGLDNIYPRQNERLAERILQNGGSIVSEYPPTTAPYQQHFLQRNRITSGLSSGVLVIEAPLKSGVRSTARFAIEQNRDVFVIPGAINNPNYEGSHELIKSGAQLVTQTSEILQYLGVSPKSAKTLFHEGRFDKLEKPQKIIVQALSAAGAPMTGDALAEVTQLPVTQISQTLTLLVLEDIIKEDSGSYFLI